MAIHKNSGLAVVAALTVLGAIFGMTPGKAGPSKTALAQSLSAAPLPTPSLATIHQEIISIPAYPYDSYLHDVYSASFNMTYKKMDWEAYDRAPKPVADRDFVALVLENEYLKVTVLPEMGGRVYECVFKATGHNEFYRNPVVKPTHWGPAEQGWWLALGGIEWCLPVEEHGYEGAISWQTTVSQRPDGVVVSVQDTTASDRLRAGIDIYMPSGKAYFTISPRVENPTARPFNYKFWLNAMFAPGGTNAPSDQLQFVLPTNQMTVHSHDERWVGVPGPGAGFDWPTLQGRDLSLLGNWPYYLGCFERPAAKGDFAGVYDHKVGEGMVRVYPSNVARGTKVFAFGYGSGALPPDLWTDGTSYYVELHGGVAPTFNDWASLSPGGQVAWTEYWYPVKDIGGFVYANQDAALNLKLSALGAVIGLATTSWRAQGTLSLRRRADGMVLFEECVPLVNPSQPCRVGPVPVGNLGLNELSLVYSDSSGKVVAAFN